MAIYEVVLRQDYFGQECVNRFNYISTGTPAAVTGSFALIAALGAISLVNTTLIGQIRGLQNASVNFVDIEARNVYSATDFYTRPFAVDTNGQYITGAALSPTSAFGFRTNRVRTDVRRGTKRFVGVTDAQEDSGGVFTGGIQAAMQDIADKLSETLTYDDEGNTLSFAPCICGKDPYETPSGKTAYKYYPTEAAQLAKTASGIAWEVYTQVRTQTSRQYGRGR